MTGILRFSLPSPVYASPEVGAELIPSPTPPDPEKNPEWAKTQLAFSVRIPRIVPATPVTFRIMTINIDNENAGGQILRIREEFGTALKILVERLDKVNPDSIKRLDIDKVIASQIKRDNLSIPARFSYEAGQQVIEFISEEDQATEALFNDIRNQNREIVSNILDGRPSLIAPVIRIRMIKGDGLSFTGAPLVRVCLQFGGTMKGKGNRLCCKNDW